MTKLRKQRNKKKFRHNVNRKRLRNKIFSVGSIGCKEVKNAWEVNKSVETNLTEMGLSYDPNKTIKIPSTKKKLKVSLMSNNDEWAEEVVSRDEEEVTEKSLVANVLATDADTPRERKIRLPNSQVEWCTYLMLKYKSDYKAMERDKKNYNQETWKQIRQKIRRFKSIPQQYDKFLEQNDLKVNEFDENKLSDDEW